MGPFITIQPIPLDEISFFPLAIHGNNGRVFFWKNRVFRAVKREYVDNYCDIFTCRLVNRLIEQDLIPDSWITDFGLDGYDMVLESNSISVTTFPQEWTFSMLKDAAIARGLRAAER